MPGYGFCKTLLGDEFYRKVFELEHAFCIQERLDRVSLSQGTPSDLLKRGRVFNNEIELRWDNGHFAMFWEAENVDNIPPATRVFHCDDRPFPLLLWPPRAPGASYPHDATQIVAVKYTKNGILQFIRFKGLK
ncbi:MAG: hypothetical protein DRH70_04160 [Candidatus Coatesbacteria bacterium]|nr:MAG: hypothetical protein DRH70_04160 [Candidatus Coatesbacteria bacterium]HDM58924.1 hypothetical protein [Bacillota bacterium]